jgi:hypothetical protein
MAPGAAVSAALPAHLLKARPDDQHFLAGRTEGAGIRDPY